MRNIGEVGSIVRSGVKERKAEFFAKLFAESLLREGQLEYWSRANHF